MRLEGILVPRRWHASGNVAAFAINTIDEREFGIEDAGAHVAELAGYLRRRVRISGTVVGSRLIRITRVELLDEPNLRGEER